jgi:crossover junction endodeoxyribonuclease RuvC
MLVLGVDIGARGAVALVDAATGELVEVHDMPVLADGPKGRAAVNPALLAELIHRAHAGHAFVEAVNARPGEGPAGAFAFGRCRGVVEGVLGAVGVPATHLAPAAWKRAVGIPRGKEGAKDAARSDAIRRWPSKAGLFARVKDDGRAEAALIAVAGLAKLNGICCPVNLNNKGESPGQASNRPLGMG